MAEGTAAPSSKASANVSRGVEEAPFRTKDSKTSLDKPGLLLRDLMLSYHNNETTLFTHRSLLLYFKKNPTVNDMVSFLL